MTPFTSVGTTRYGLMAWPTNDTYIGRSLELYGEYNTAEASIFTALIRPGMTVLDCGANIGTHTVHFARLCDPGITYAFEPSPYSFYYLCANVVLGNHLNIRPYRVALGAYTGTINVPVYDPRSPANYGGLAINKDYNSGETCDLVTIDRLAKSQSIGKIDFIKIDVEGMEREVLFGAAFTIREHRPLLYVECDRANKSDALIDYIRSLGYVTYLHCPPLYSDANFRGNNANIFDRCVSINLLCLPDGIGNSLGLQEVTKLIFPDEWGATRYENTVSASE